jgi:hypothetical protein
MGQWSMRGRDPRHTKAIGRVIVWGLEMLSVASNDARADTPVGCPKCSTALILAAITPHPINARMERHTYLCVQCNQTKTYVLPAK